MVYWSDQIVLKMARIHLKKAFNVVSNHRNPNYKYYDTSLIKVKKSKIKETTDTKCN